MRRPSAASQASRAEAGRARSRRWSRFLRACYKETGMQRPFRRFLGVDLGGGKGKKTAVARLELSSDGLLEVAEVGTSKDGQPFYDAALLSYLGQNRGERANQPATSSYCSWTRYERTSCVLSTHRRECRLRFSIALRKTESSSITLKRQRTGPSHPSHRCSRASIQPLMAPNRIARNCPKRPAY